MKKENNGKNNTHRNRAENLDLCYMYTVARVILHKRHSAVNCINYYADAVNRLTEKNGFHFKRWVLLVSFTLKKRKTKQGTNNRFRIYLNVFLNALFNALIVLCQVP